MNTPAPELSRTVRVDTIGAVPHRLSIEASEEERQKLARRFGIVAIGSLAAVVELIRDDTGIRATGSLAAEVTQSCVATGEPIDENVSEPFEILFLPRPAGGAPDEEIELSEADCDVVFYDGAAIDVGEAVAESLSLSLDPWPRLPNADELLRESGVKSEEEAGAFGALAALRDKLKGGE
jgi:uncharacterized metal-binding protein YceD (DUF177 family)